MSLNQAISLLFLAATAGLVWWLEGILQSSRLEALRKENNRPDFYMKNFTIRRYDVNGSLEYRGTGETLIRYPRDDSMDISRPDLLSMEKGESPISIRARRANLKEDGDLVYLSGNVHIRQEKSDNNDLLDIKGENLFIDTRLDYIESSTPIIIKSGKHEIHGANLQAWTGYKKVRIQNSVRGIHDP